MPLTRFDAARRIRTVADFAAALKLDPKLPIVHVNRGSALQAKGDRNGAIASYRAALAIDAGFKPARDSLAEIGVTPYWPASLRGAEGDEAISSGTCPWPEIASLRSQ